MINTPPADDTPETIYADFYDRKHMDEGEFLASFTKGKLPQHQIPYTRKDLSDKRIAEARNEALEKAANLAFEPALKAAIRALKGV